MVVTEVNASFVSLQYQTQAQHPGVFEACRDIKTFLTEYLTRRYSDRSSHALINISSNF